MQLSTLPSILQLRTAILAGSVAGRQAVGIKIRVKLTEYAERDTVGHHMLRFSVIKPLGRHQIGQVGIKVGVVILVGNICQGIGCAIGEGIDGVCRPDCQW